MYTQWGHKSVLKSCVWRAAPATAVHKTQQESPEGPIQPGMWNPALFGFNLLVV
jgi:hypothetical protein